MTATRPEPELRGFSLADPVAWWELDVSAARPLIETLADVEAMLSEDVDALMASIRVNEVAASAPYLVGPLGGRDRMLGRPVGEFWPTQSQPVLAKLIVAVVNDLQCHAPRSCAITSLMLRDATMTVQMKPDGSSDLVHVAVVGVIHDKRSRCALRASEDRYQKLIHHLPIALLQVDASEVRKIFDRLRSRSVTDFGGYLDDHPELVEHALRLVRVTDVNRNAELLFRADRASCMRPIDFLFAAAPDVARRVMAAHFDGRRSYEEIMKLRTFDDRLLDVRFTVTFPTPPERVDITLISLEDVTDRLRTEAQLRQLQADFSRAARISTLGELATSIAHEVNQPLSAIVTNAETSLRWLARDEPNLAKVEQLTRRIAENAHRANEIVQRIRGMAARHAPERILLDINEVIDEALLFIRHDVESRQITLLVDRARGLPPLAGDRVQLQQVIVNLLLNSIQAVAQRRDVKGQIELRTSAHADQAILISVRDNGLGIASENLDRIFEGFFTTKDDGMGIGLAICQSIIVAHGGNISVSNHPEGGAMFEISLPAAASLPTS